VEAELKRRRNPPGRPDRGASSAGDMVAQLWDRARAGTYFDCLGLAPDAGTGDVREAWLRMSEAMAGLRQSVAGDPQALEILARVEKVASDGFEVLSDPDLRLAYVKALDK